MNRTYNLEESLQILERTPSVIRQLLSGLSEDWTDHRENETSWSSKEIVAHLIEGEKSDWIPRLQLIVETGENTPFEAFDMVAHLEEAKSHSLEQLLHSFEEIRQQNVQKLKEVMTNEALLDRTGIHPVLGKVTVRQLLSTWTVHDLNHIAQLARVMANRYEEEVGPWKVKFRDLSKMT